MEDMEIKPEPVDLDLERDLEELDADDAPSLANADRRGGKVLTYKGYRYSRNNTSQARIYWRCARSYCGETIITNRFDINHANPEIRIQRRPLGEHAHEPDDDQIRRREFVDDVVALVRQDPTLPIRKAYNLVYNSGHHHALDTICIPTFPEIKSQLQRARAALRQPSLRSKKTGMVKLHIKRGDESQFLFETTVQQPVEDAIKELVLIHNGRLKVERICSEINELAEHGTSLPPNMQGLTDDQIVDLKLIDEWGQKCEPSGGSVECKDPIGRRNGKAPNEKMKEVLTKTISEAKKIISKNQVSANVCVTQPMIKDALDQLRGAVTIVYPMSLPPHDPIRMEFEGSEELDGTQASLSVLEEENTSLWFSGKEMYRGKKLCDYVGKNEKTKIIAKLQKKGQGAPAREAVFSEEERKQMMLHAYRKQEEWKKMQEESEDSYLSSPWADSSQLKNQLQGINNVKWGPR